MANSLSAALRTSNLLTSLCFNYTKYGIPTVLQVRHLYARETLGIEGYSQTRDKIKSQFSNMSEKFRAKMNEYVTDADSKNMIFTEDLKNMVHLAESNDEDVRLVTEMMKKFNNQNKELRFGSFVFGPVVMRMFYFLNKPDAALESFKSPELEGFFDQLMSYQLLLDLLYENKRYDDVVNTFELIKSKQIQGTKYPKNIVVLTMAACYKQNTPESLNYALSLWAELQDVGHVPMRRASTFCSGLALNQGKPEVALEIISAVKKQNYMTVRNIRVAALADIGRIDDVLPLLKSVLEIDDPKNLKHTFTKDVIERIRNAVEKQSNPEIKQEFSRIEKYLVEQGHITQEVLDEQLCKEITAPAYILANQRDRQQPRMIQRNQYQGKKSTNYRVYNQRPGLQDMH